ncbi:hypothetical protein G7Y89_g1784 [Cudoniella acicularis]|uniref:Fibronectin type-III domain-containing protein n=1 Tax=Cudoniella acicularis TaxID=354080 RepID=A0A8H4W734_9HELO|nr:hypothetical protein G7Y89_g1784 [Cudoniella acicularis]
MRPSGALLSLLASAPFAIAIPTFSSPTSDFSVAGGTAFTVTWTDDGTAPSIADLTTYTLHLYAGTSTTNSVVWSAPDGSFASGSSITITIPATTSGSSPDAYFFGMVSTAAGGTVTTYSPRFSLTGMTGVFPATVQAVLPVSGATAPVPANVNNVVQAAAAASVNQGAWGTPYNLQTGLTKYAPMQPVPPTAITATNTSPLWPTSSVSLASTFLPIPSIVTTLTQANTFSVSSHANTKAHPSAFNVGVITLLLTDFLKDTASDFDIEDICEMVRAADEAGVALEPRREIVNCVERDIEIYRQEYMEDGEDEWRGRDWKNEWKSFKANHSGSKHYNITKKSKAGRK